MNKKDLSERGIITQFIMPAIKKAGLNIEKQVREEVYFNACRTIKLLVIQQVGASPTLLKATSCRTRSMFLFDDYLF